MAVPTFTSITPAAGKTQGGNVVAIAGTGFRVPVVPATGYLGGDAQRTVKVEFQGVEAPWAEAATTSLIYCRVPEWVGAHSGFPLDLDVRIANLDDSGVEIAGEAVTALDAYTIDRPDFTAECYMTRVVRELLRLLKRHLMSNVAITLGRDYDQDTTDWERLRASAPCLQLFGPLTPINRFYSINREDVQEDPLDSDAYYRRNVPVTVDLDFDVQVWARTPMELQAISQAFLLLFRDIVEISVLRDPSQPSLGSVSYEIEIPWNGYPGHNLEPNFSDLFRFESRLLIRGVHLDDEAGTIIERGWRITANDGEPVIESESA